MTTKAPSAVEPAAADTLEKIAYESVASVETKEPNDRNRLGYHVWRWLTNPQGSLDDTIRESGVRLVTPADVALKSIREHLSAKGIPVS